MKKYFKRNFEVVFWVSSLVGLAILPMPDNGFSFCPIHMMGLNFCPGCGLGKSIHLAFHGEFLLSFHKHILGIPAILIILHRIFLILKKNFLNSYHNADHQSHSTTISV